LGIRLRVDCLRGTYRLAISNFSAPLFDAPGNRRDVMNQNAYPEATQIRENVTRANDTAPTQAALPNRLLTAFEVAEFVGCHEETVRRAYLRGLLVSQRFGVRSRRFHPADVLDWIKRGAPTRIS
jgi:excisionase family DNA binding protein